MLNPFPSLLFLGFFAPTLLRVTAALVLGYSAYYLLQERRAVTQAHLPIIGKPAVWMVWLSCSITTLIAAALFFGYGTQIAALLGAIVSIKYAFIPKRLADLSPLSRTTYFLVFVICLSLLISGAGAFAMDLPL